jgi:hypothetical protein
MAEMDQVPTGTPMDEAAASAAPAAPLAEGTAPEPEDEQEYVPIQQYNRLYGKLKERERELEALSDRPVPQPPQPQVAQVPQTPVDPTTDYLRRTLLDPIMGELRSAQQGLSEIRAERAAAQFWNRPENKGYEAEFRSEVDGVYRAAMANGYATSPDLILDALVGRARRAAEAARRDVATETIRRIKTVNTAARVETGASAPAKPAATPNEMSTADFEANFGNEPFYQRGGRR